MKRSGERHGRTVDARATRQDGPVEDGQATERPRPVAKPDSAGGTDTRAAAPSSPSAAAPSSPARATAGADAGSSAGPASAPTPTPQSAAATPQIAPVQGATSTWDTPFGETEHMTPAPTAAPAGEPTPQPSYEPTPYATSTPDVCDGGGPDPAAAPHPTRDTCSFLPH